MVFATCSVHADEGRTGRACRPTRNAFSNTLNRTGDAGGIVGWKRDTLSLPPGVVHGMSVEREQYRQWLAAQV